jgi:hypothetical protein
MLYVSTPRAFLVRSFILRDGASRLLRMRSLMVRSAATPRVSNHENA